MLGSSHCVATARCRLRVDLCGVCGGDDSTCFLGESQVARALQAAASLEEAARAQDRASRSEWQRAAMGLHPA